MVILERSEGVIHAVTNERAPSVFQEGTWNEEEVMTGLVYNLGGKCFWPHREADQRQRVGVHQEKRPKKKRSRVHALVCKGKKSVQVKQDETLQKDRPGNWKHTWPH